MASRYVGKVGLLLKQDGFWGAVKGVFHAVVALAKPIGSGDILFISSGLVGDSSRYRVRNVMEELEGHGFVCKSTVQENPALPSCVKKFKVFVFHKAAFIPQVENLFILAQKAGKEIIFETDDLLFEPELVKDQDFFKNSNEMMKQFYANGVGCEFVGDQYVKTCTTTTTFLAEKLRQHGKKVFIVPNKLSKKDIAVATKNIEIKTKKADEADKNNESEKVVSLGYFSGTHSHNKDFEVAADALLRIMEKYSNVMLFLAGPLDISESFEKFSNRIIKFPFVSREEHFGNLAEVSINIAPLEIGNPFCEAKSELKFFEAAIVKTPTIASATQTFKEAIEDGVDGFLASNSDEWFEKLERLVASHDLRKAMAEKAYQKTIRKYTTQNSNNEEYYEYLKSKVHKA